MNKIKKLGVALGLMALSFSATSAVVLNSGFVDYTDDSFIDVTFDGTTVWGEGDWTITQDDAIPPNPIITQAFIFSDVVAGFLGAPSVELNFSVSALDVVTITSFNIAGFQDGTGASTFGAYFDEVQTIAGLCNNFEAPGSPEYQMSCAQNSTDWIAFGSGDLRSIDLVYTPVASVPLPAAAWLFGSGLIGLVAMKRKRS